MPEVLALTSTYTESGIGNLKPLGIFMGYKYSSSSAHLGREEALADLKEKARAAGCTYVFNVRFESWGVGHPNNNEYGSRATGDGYFPI